MGEKIKVLRKTRLLVCARGVESFVRTLSDRADSGDRNAEVALAKLRDALEAAAQLCDQGRELEENEFLAIYDGLLILQGALEGHSEYPTEVLRLIAKRLVEDCGKLGFPPPDVSFLFEEEGDG